jgi:hypothetical protein
MKPNWTNFVSILLIGLIILLLESSILMPSGASTVGRRACWAADSIQIWKKLSECFKRYEEFPIDHKRQLVVDTNRMNFNDNHKESSQKALNNLLRQFMGWRFHGCWLLYLFCKHILDPDISFWAPGGLNLWNYIDNRLMNQCIPDWLRYAQKFANLR